ncbi:hypothetical protein E2C01_094481 [Portunus trituberculatus]|uniref:Uncharacterized protein n=1 Tax=Portunus trituberculatus TaxID=210409 RepID=A0A5B7JXQ3_PORTR|nr:hypothetical protein [Portunus trituberculatus]
MKGRTVFRESVWQ